MQAPFIAAHTPVALPPEARRMLQDFVNDREGHTDESEPLNVNTELKNFWEKYVGDNPQKLGLFAGVLRELRPAITNSTAIWEWWLAVIKPVLGSSAYKRPALDDARAFAIGVMTSDEDDSVPELAKLSNRMCNDLLKVYLARSQSPSEGKISSASENAQVAQQVEDVLVIFGRKKPKELFVAIDNLITSPSSRLQALSLLNSFLRHQTPHIYRVTETPLLEHLLQCLMNDTSTTALSMALTSVIMLLPHIPGSLAPFLPRMFLIYSRLLCWERFSPLSSEEEKKNLTDDRIANESDEEGNDPGNVGLDSSWSILQSDEGVIEAATPELLNYFTYLYGLFPLNFMSYIRKARRYLKDRDFPGADGFDLDSEVIRRRSEQFRKVHLLHPNFCHLTIEDEVADAKWSKMDAADVVGECYGLCVYKVKTLASPGPPPAGKLPDIPPVPPLSAISKRSSVPDSPALESLRSTSVRYESLSSPGTGPQSRQIGEDEQRRPRSKSSGTTLRTSPSIEDVQAAAEAPSDRIDKEAAPQNSTAWLQREVQLLKSDLNFERWHKSQYSQHISQITRRNVKDATIEAETLNLINANKALKRQLEQVQKAREATLKDSSLTRKQANSLEANMAERFNKLKIEQEKWRLDDEELKRLRSEMPQYRDLLVAAEARELGKDHELQLAKRDLEKLQETQTQLQDLMRRVREYEYKEFEFEHTIREKEILENEKQLLQMKVERYEDERDRAKRAFAERLADLESQLVDQGQRPMREPSVDSQALAETQARLLQLRKAHSRLLENFTDLELDYQAARSQLEAYQAQGSTIRIDHFGPSRTSSRPISKLRSKHDTVDFGFEFVGDYNPAEASYALPSASEPSRHSHHQYSMPPGFALPASPPPSSAEPTIHSSAGLTFRPSNSHGGSIATKSSGSAGAAAQSHAAFNPSAPLGEDEGASVYSKATSRDGGGAESTTSSAKKAKIAPDSQLRVYGRGASRLSFRSVAQLEDLHANVLSGQVVRRTSSSKRRIRRRRKAKVEAARRSLSSGVCEGWDEGYFSMSHSWRHGT